MAFCLGHLHFLRKELRSDEWIHRYVVHQHAIIIMLHFVFILLLLHHQLTSIPVTYSHIQPKPNTWFFMRWNLCVRRRIGFDCVDDAKISMFHSASFTCPFLSTFSSFLPKIPSNMKLSIINSSSSTRRVSKPPSSPLSVCGCSWWWELLEGEYA